MEKTITLTNSKLKGKRYTVKMENFPNMEPHSHSFGSKGGKTYVDGRTVKEKGAFIARHKKDKGWDNKHAGIYFSRYLLWGPHDSLEKNIKSLAKKLNSKIIVKGKL